MFMPVCLQLSMKMKARHDLIESALNVYGAKAVASILILINNYNNDNNNYI